MSQVGVPEKLSRRLRPVLRTRVWCYLTGLALGIILPLPISVLLLIVGLASLVVFPRSSFDGTPTDAWEAELTTERPTVGPRTPSGVSSANDGIDPSTSHSQHPTDGAW